MLKLKYNKLLNSKITFRCCDRNLNSRRYRNHQQSKHSIPVKTCPWCKSFSFIKMDYVHLIECHKQFSERHGISTRVTFIASTEDFIKQGIYVIGKTNNMKRELDTLNRASPFPYIVINTLPIDSYAELTERYANNKIRGHFYKITETTNDAEMS